MYVKVYVRKMKVPPRFELGSLDSKSRVLTITPWDLTHGGLLVITVLCFNLLFSVMDYQSLSQSTQRATLKRNNKI